MNIDYDFTLLSKQNLADTGIDLSDTVHVKYASDFGIVTANLLKTEYGFGAVIENDDSLIECQRVFGQINWAKNLVVVGIGGSDLGGRMLQDALQSDAPTMKVIFIGDTTDPEQLRQLFKQIMADETVFNIVSKSGSTTETVAAYLVLKAYVKDHVGEAWGKHFVFTTSKESLLDREAAENDILVLEHDEVGGRYSVLSKVGLLPALAMSIDTERLLSGARKMYAKLATVSQKENIAWLLALTQYQFVVEHEIDTVVLMPYLWRLSVFGSWFRQLWAESLGKDGKGILPIKAVGPADQHSQLQYYNDGKWLSSFLFIQAKYYASDIVVDSEDSKEFDYFHHVPLEDLVKFECEATRYSLAKNKRPSALLTIETLDEEHVGALVVLFETAVVYLAQLLDVNPFDQPGVEESKQFLYGMLGRADYVSKVEELQAMKLKFKEEVVKIRD